MHIIGVGTLHIEGATTHFCHYHLCVDGTCTLSRDEPRLRTQTRDARLIITKYARIAHVRAASVQSAVDIGGASERIIKLLGGL